jgi:hypothetical protein
MNVFALAVVDIEPLADSPARMAARSIRFDVQVLAYSRSDVSFPVPIFVCLGNVIDSTKLIGA